MQYLELLYFIYWKWKKKIFNHSLMTAMAATQWLLRLLSAHSVPVDKSVPKNHCCDQTCLVGNTFHLLQDVTSYIYENLPLTQASIWASGRHLWWSRFTRGGTEVVAPFSFWPLGRLLLRKSGDISKISSFLPSGFKYDRNRFSGCPAHIVCLNSPLVQYSLLVITLYKSS